MIPQKAMRKFFRTDMDWKTKYKQKKFLQMTDLFSLSLNSMNICFLCSCMKNVAIAGYACILDRKSA